MRRLLRFSIAVDRYKKPAPQAGRSLLRPLPSRSRIYPTSAYLSAELGQARVRVERATLFCNIKGWVRGFESISAAGNPLTPTLSPIGERERTEFAAHSWARAMTVVGALAAFVVGAAAPVSAQTASALPPGEGRELVTTACTQCHTLSVITAGRDGPVGWKKHVYNMVLRGTQLTSREADTVIQYLITNFGPTAPATTASALPSGPGKELVETRCAVCHNLERVTVVKRQKRDWETVVANMYERWGMSAPDEVNAISAYLIAQFGRE
jgi:mono/diheme cytochrome c family protein